MVQRTNWNEIFSSEDNVLLFREFARGTVSGRIVEKTFYGTRLSPEVRQLIRVRGVERARDASRRALSRRNVNV